MRNGIGNSIFFMNHASKGGGGGGGWGAGTCIYNKRLTSALNPIPPETCYCQS